jgi:ribosomal protein L7/L12
MSNPLDDLKTALILVHEAAVKVHGQDVEILVQHPFARAVYARYPLRENDPTVPTTDEIESWRQNKSIEVIKSIRYRTGFGLRESKDLAEKWEYDGLLPKRPPFDPFRGR